MKSIVELRDEIDNGSLTTDELFNNSVELAKKYQEDYNSFVSDLKLRNITLVLERKDGKLRKILLSPIPIPEKKDGEQDGINSNYNYINRSNNKFINS